MRHSRAFLVAAVSTCLWMGALGAPGVASASPSAPTARDSELSLCSGGDFCLFADKNYAGDIAEIPANHNVPNLSSFGMYKRASSLYNKTNYAVELYSKTSYGTGPFGSQICVESGVTIANLASFNAGFSFNDKAVSLKYVGRKCPA